MGWDLLIRGAKLFDGSGGPGVMADVAVSDGRISAIGQQLPIAQARTCIEAENQFLVPGLIDIHTHEDLEVELIPGLPEVVRHGTTSVVVGNCSIGLAYGALRDGQQDPIVDCFARVENIPKSVLQQVAERATWQTSAEYLAHLNELPLGPNVAPLIPHSMLRIAVMGLDASINRQPTTAELSRMTELLEQGMHQGYVGFSTDGLPLHFLANQPNLAKRIPTQYAKYPEYKQLTDVVREHNRVWQMTPATDDSALTLRLFALTSARLHGKPLKITALAAIDSVNNRSTKARALLFSRLLNSSLADGHFRMQALAAPFKIWSEGAVSPLAEANPLMRQLIETELDDRAARVAVLSQPEYVEAFREMWARGKSGWNLGHLRRRLRMETEFLTRDLADMVVYRSPVPQWAGRSMAEVYTDYLVWCASEAQYQGPELSEQNRAFNEIGAAVRCDGEFFVALLRHFDRDLIWHYVNANRDPKVIKQLLLDPVLLPGFNDSGAHVTNMAFYDGNLRALRIGLEDSEALFSTMLRRLTSEPAAFFGLAAGSIEVGAAADLTLLNPEQLRSYDGDANIELIHRDEFGCEQLVNRSGGVVAGTFVAGQQLWDGQNFTADFGRKGAGRALTANNKQP